MVYPYVLKEASVEFAESLHIIFENSIKTGEVPNFLLDAHVTSILRKEQLLIRAITSL